MTWEDLSGKVEIAWKTLQILEEKCVDLPNFVGNDTSESR